MQPPPKFVLCSKTWRQHAAAHRPQCRLLVSRWGPRAWGCRALTRLGAATSRKGVEESEEEEEEAFVAEAQRVFNHGGFHTSAFSRDLAAEEH